MNISNRNELEALVAGFFIALGTLLGALTLQLNPILAVNTALFTLSGYMIISSTSKLKLILCFILGGLPVCVSFYFLHEFAGDTYIKIVSVIASILVAIFLTDHISKK